MRRPQRGSSGEPGPERKKPRPSAEGSWSQGTLTSGPQPGRSAQVGTQETSTSEGPYSQAGFHHSLRMSYDGALQTVIASSPPWCFRSLPKLSRDPGLLLGGPGLPFAELSSQQDWRSDRIIACYASPSRETPSIPSLAPANEGMGHCRHWPCRPSGHCTFRPYLKGGHGKAFSALSAVQMEREVRGASFSRARLKLVLQQSTASWIKHKWTARPGSEGSFLSLQRSECRGPGGEEVSRQLCALALLQS